MTKYILQLNDLEWTDQTDFEAADDEHAESIAIQWLTELGPDAGTSWRLLKFIGQTEIVYKEPPPPPEPELEQLSFS